VCVCVCVRVWLRCKAFQLSRPSVP
jgi:hypothetical protein